MKQKLFKLGVILLSGLGLTGLQAQESVHATGGNASGSGGSVSYSVGQVVYQTCTETIGSVAQGVQQPYEISVISTIEDAEGITLSISAAPNPAAEYIILFVYEFEISDLSYQLYSLNGKLLQRGIISGRETSIVLSNLAASTYLVKVIQNNTEVKSFKIIKK